MQLSFPELFGPLDETDLGWLQSRGEIINERCAAYGHEAGPNWSPEQLQKVLKACAGDPNISEQDLDDLREAVAVEAMRQICRDTPMAWQRFHTQPTGGTYELGITGPGRAYSLAVARTVAAMADDEEPLTVPAFLDMLVNNINDHYLGPRYPYRTIAEARRDDTGHFGFKMTNQASGGWVEHVFVEPGRDLAMLTNGSAALTRGMNRKTVNRHNIANVSLFEQLVLRSGPKRWTLSTDAGDVIGDLTPAGCKTATRLSKAHGDLFLVVAQIWFDRHGTIDDIAGIMVPESELHTLVDLMC